MHASTSATTPAAAPARSPRSLRWRVVDIVVAAVLGVAIGLVFWAWNTVGYAWFTAMDGLTPGLGGLAVGNGLLVPIGSLATGRQQRRADALITKVLGAPQIEIIAAVALHYLLLALFAAVLATVLGVAAAWGLTLALLDVDFTVNSWVLATVNIGAIVIVAVLGATTILGAFRMAPARLLREL